MSTTVEPQQARASEPAAPPELPACERCGSQLATEQEWCLECGAARTILHPARDWRVAVVVVSVVIALALAAFAIVLASLS